MNRGEQLSVKSVRAETGLALPIKKVMNNTFEIGPDVDGRIAWRYHHTNVAEKNEFGIHLYTDGWRTSTTQERINMFLGQYAPYWKVWTVSRVWYLGYTQPDMDRKQYVFKEGITIGPQGEVHGAGEVPDKALIKQIKEYAKGFADALPVDRPDKGDCWGCLFHEEGKPGTMPMGTDHLVSHMEEKYYVPSLLMRVLAEHGITPGVVAGSAWFAWAFKLDGGGVDLLTSWHKRQFAKWIYQYMYDKLINKKGVR